MNHPKFTSAPQHNFSVAFLLQIINGISDPIFVKDRQHQWVLLNDAFCDFMGHSREELLGKSDYDFFPKQEADVFWETDELVFTTGITNENEEHFTDAFGVTHVISTKKSLFEDETGKKLLVGTIRDITRNIKKYNRQVEAELRESKQLLQLVMDNIPQLIFWKDRNSLYLGCNRNFARVAGVGSPENIIGKTDYDLPWKKQESDWFRECDRCVMESGKPELHIIETQQQADGKQSWVDTNKIPLCDAQGNVIGILGTYEDITARKQAEIALLETEAKLQKLAGSVPGMLYQFLLQPDGSMFFTYVSSGSYEIYGLQPEEIQADANLIISVIHPDDRQHFEESVAVSAQTLQPWQWEGRFVLSSGQIKWLKGASRPEAQANGTIVWYGVLLDTTERKQAEEALKESEKKYRDLVETSQDMIWSVDNQGCFTFVNQAVRHIYGYQPEEMIGHPFTDFASPEEIEKDLDVHHRILAGESLLQYESVHITKDGRRVSLLFNAIILRDAEGNAIGTTGIASNITERKQAESALIRSNAVLQAQQEAAIDAILIVDENFHIVSYNNKLGDIWQIPLALVETGDEQQILPLAVEKTLNPEEFLAKVQYLYQHPEETSRDEVALKDGRTLDRYSAPVRRRETACRQTSLSEDYYGRIWCFRDITQSKQAEEVLRKSEARLRQQAKELEQALDQLQRTQIQLVQSEKMSSLGQLVAGIAHEINNPVNFIYGNLCHTDEYTQDLLSVLQLYQQYYPHPVQEIQDYLEVIELDFLKSDLPQILTSMKVGAERIRSIVLSLRTFSRLDEAEIKTVDIHEGIDSTLMILQSRLNANGDRPAIEVIKKYSNLPLVECYAGQLNQVFINILTNAIDALEDGHGSLVIGNGKESSNYQLPITHYPLPTICIYTELDKHNRVTIGIANNGPAIPEEVKQRLFDPFFTTKSVGKGTGLGLSICYQIVTERHGGSLQCISEAGQGAEFVITIPLVQACEIPNF